MLTDAQRWYLRKISPDERVTIRPYDPRLAETSAELNEAIFAVAPKLSVIHMGAAALGISGRNDIDLYALCGPGASVRYRPVLTELFGSPVHEKAELTQWELHRNGFPVTIYLTDPESDPMKEQIQLFHLLQRDAEILQEYASLKESMDGQALRDYQRKQYEFYNQILGLQA